MTTYNLFPGAAPSVQAYDKGSTVSVATTFKVTSTAWVTQLRYLSGHGADYTTFQRTGSIWRINPVSGDSMGMVVNGLTMPAPTAPDQWVALDLPTPYQLTPGWLYKVSIHCADGGYPATLHYFEGTNDYIYGPVVVPKSGNVPWNQQGSFKYSPFISDIPDSSFQDASYYADVTITDVNPSLKVNLKSYESGLWTPHAASPKIYTAGGWATKIPKRWNGSAWVNLP